MRVQMDFNLWEIRNATEAAWKQILNSQGYKMKMSVHQKMIEEHLIPGDGIECPKKNGKPKYPVHIEYVIL